MIPEEPTNLQCSEVTAHSAKLSWVQPRHTLAQSEIGDEPTKYRIEVEVVPKLTTEIGGTFSEHTLTELQPGNTYQVVVTAENSDGSVDSKEISFRTPCESMLQLCFPVQWCRGDE